MASAPVFIGTPKVWHAAISTANTNRDGTGTLGTIVSAGSAPGSRVDSVRIQAAGTTTAGVVRLFVSDGTNHRLEREVMVSAATPSATVQAWSADVVFRDGLTLPNGSSLRASTHNAESFNVIARGGDYV